MRFLLGEGREIVFYRGFKVIAIVFQQALDCCLLESVDWIGLDVCLKQTQNNSTVTNHHSLKREN